MPDSKYQDMSMGDLEKKARDYGISGHSSMKKDELIKALEKHEHDRGGGGSKHD